MPKPHFNNQASMDRNRLSSEECVLTALVSASRAAKAATRSPESSRSGAAALLLTFLPGAISRSPGNASLLRERYRRRPLALHLGDGSTHPALAGLGPDDEPAEEYHPSRLPTVCFDCFVTKMTGGTPAIKRDGPARLTTALDQKWLRGNRWNLGVNSDLSKMRVALFRTPKID